MKHWAIQNPAFSVPLCAALCTGSVGRILALGLIWGLKENNPTSTTTIAPPTTSVSPNQAPFKFVVDENKIISNFTIERQDSYGTTSAVYCMSSMPPGNTCQGTVSFRPVAGKYRASLTVNSDNKYHTPFVEVTDSMVESMKKQESQEEKNMQIETVEIPGRSLEEE